MGLRSASSVHSTCEAARLRGCEACELEVRHSVAPEAEGRAVLGPVPPQLRVRQQTSFARHDQPPEKRRVLGRETTNLAESLGKLPSIHVAHVGDERGVGEEDRERLCAGFFAGARDTWSA